MPLYRFQVTDAQGKVQEVTIDGDSQEDAVNRLRNRRLFPVQCYGEAGAGTFVFRKSFNVYAFTNRLVPLLQAHVPLDRALGIMADGCAKEKEHDVIVSLRKGLHEGKSFSELIRSQGDRFPKIYANLVETGEESGCLEAVMGNLQHFINDSKEQKDFLITSSIYPGVILTITLGVLMLVFGVFIPRFAQIFMDMGKELPTPTQILLSFSRIVNTLWPLWLALLLAGIWFAIRVRRGGRERNWWDRQMIKVPILGRLLVTVDVSRFIRTLSILISNHVHLLKSVQIAEKVIQNHTIAQTLTNVVPELRGGSKLSEALRHSKFIPLDVVQMLRVGEESGETGPMLAKVADELEKSVKVEIKRLLALFEPAVIVLLALVVLLVVISIFLAVIEMNNV